MISPGKLDYFQTFGHSSISPVVKPMERDTVFAFASLTKLITTIAVLQLVERDLIKLDEDVTQLLPGLGKQEILIGFKDDQTPITKKRKNAITLRLLLTHSFGGMYDFMSGDIQAFKKFHGYPTAAKAETVEQIFGTPLLDEPGESWFYSGGLDWAGRLVEKLSGMTLDDYMTQNIANPLGLKSLTFWPDSHPEIGRRLASMTIRDNKTGTAVQSRKPIKLNASVKEACGGQGACGTVAEFVEILSSLLNDDERLLKKETTAMMFEPQLTPNSKAALVESFKEPGWAVGHFPDTGEYDWGLGGLLIDGDKHPYRKRGTLLWSGNANLFWVGIIFFAPKR